MMPETELDNLFKVEHDENYVLNSEQTRQLIWQKFKRNGVTLDELKERESRLSARE